MTTVPRMGDVNRVVRRHRRLVALLSVLVVLGVAAVGVHAALCRCDDAACTACLCATASAFATLAGIGWSKGAAPFARTRTIAVRILAAPTWLVISPPRNSARAGPVQLAVLRL